MKTKLLLTAVFLVSFFEGTLAQEYHPLLNNSTWVVSDWVSCCRQPYVRFIAPALDETIGAFEYKKFKDPFPLNAVDTVYIREDVIARKVYRHEEAGDVLIYDFSLETGDQITLESYGPITFVASVDEVGCNVGQRKRIVLSSVEQYNGHTLTQTWIEGVGSTAYPFYPDRNMWNVMSTGGGVVYTTRCGFQGSEHVYGNPNNCQSFLGEDEIENPGRQFSFSPNPVTDMLFINSEITLQNAAFRLYNLQGQLIREVNGISGNTFMIPRGNLADGLYFMQLLENGKPVWTNKVLVD